MKKCALYLRVSTQHQDYERQKKELIDYATKDDCQIVYIFEEKMSGLSNARPEFIRLQSLTKDDIDRIYVWEISRISRKAYKMLEVCEEFADKGISIYSKKENLHTIEEDGKWNTLAQLTLGLFATMAQNEVQNIKDRVKSGLKEKISSGKISYATTPPFGYKKVNKQLVIDEEQAEIVRTIFNLYLEGHSMRQLSETFGVRVKTILKYEVYTGEKTNSYNPEQKLKTPQIISKELFNQVQIKIKQNSNGEITKRYKDNVFSCKLFCADCGNTLYAIKRVKHGDTMKCPNHHIAVRTDVVRYISKVILEHIFTKKTEGIREMNLKKELELNQKILLQKKENISKITEREEKIVKKIKALIELDIDTSDDETLLKQIRKVKLENQKEFVKIQATINDIEKNIKEEKEHTDWSSISKSSNLTNKVIRDNIVSIKVKRIAAQYAYLVYEIKGTMVKYHSLILTRKMSPKCGIQDRILFIRDMIVDYTDEEVMRMNTGGYYTKFNFEPYTLF